jgi:hypothetical protein
MIFMMLAPEAMMLHWRIGFFTRFYPHKQKAPALHGGKTHAERTPLSLQTRHWICVKFWGSSLILRWE